MNQFIQKRECLNKELAELFEDLYSNLYNSGETSTEYDTLKSELSFFENEKRILTKMINQLVDRKLKCNNLKNSIHEKIHTLKKIYNVKKIDTSLSKKLYDGHFSYGGTRNAFATIPLKGQWYIIMESSNTKTPFIFDLEDFDSVTFVEGRIPSWYIMQNGYVGSTNGGDHSYLHHMVTNYSGNGKGKDSIDHINRVKTDNRKCNLRIVSQTVQNQNTGKRRRKKNARPLPEQCGITENDIPKYVNYNVETITQKATGKVTVRDFFRIEKHPKLEKSVTSSKSAKFTLLEKLEQVKQKLVELDGHCILHSNSETCPDDTLANHLKQEYDDIISVYRQLKSP